MDNEVISYCVGPLSKDFLSKCPHHATPCINLHSRVPSENVSDTSDLFKLSPLSSSMPVPLTHLTKLSCEGKLVWLSSENVSYMWYYEC